MPRSPRGNAGKGRGGPGTRHRGLDGPSRGIRAVRTIRSLISRVFWVQCVLAVTVAAAAMSFGHAAALSAFVGGVNSLVPTVYFARKVLGTPAGAADKGAFGVWMRAEVAKIAIVCGLFIAAFVLLEGLDMAALFAGFIVVHVGGVLASLTLDPRGGGN